jgi:uncharacterized protein
MFFSRKQNYVEEEIEKYFEAVQKCKDRFFEGMVHFIEHGITEEFLGDVQKIKKYEGIADDIRDGIERRMYEESLIPESRGDVLAFLENFDVIPNNMEGIVQFVDEVQLSFPDIPPKELDHFRRELKDLCSGVLDALELALESGRYFFTEPSKVRDFTIAIDRKESECDSIESNLKRYVFHQDGFTELQRLLFYKLLERIGDIADLCEAFQRRIILLSLKSLY